MTTEITKIIKNALFFGIIISALTTMGGLINIFLPWTWLKTFFIFIRQILQGFEWFFPTDTLITIIGLSLLLKTILMGYQATMTVVNWFKTH